MRQGNTMVIEESYKNLRQYDKLSFFYAINGDRPKLNKMLQISK
jgi:hypothetical protein